MHAAAGLSDQLEIHYGGCWLRMRMQSMSDMSALWHGKEVRIAPMHVPLDCMCSSSTAEMQQGARRWQV
jgi:hypothetical protein